MDETTTQVAPEQPPPPNPTFLPADWKPSPNGHRKHAKWKPWHYVVMGVGIPILAFFVALGADAFGQWAFHGPAPTAQPTAQTAHRTHSQAPARTRPRYDLAGYHAAVTGQQERAFASALWVLRRDIGRSQFSTQGDDATKVVDAATAWLTVLRHTNPPPAFAANKASYLAAAMRGKHAANTMLEGLHSLNLAQLQTGADLAKQAQNMLLHPSPGKAQG